jgi:tape measure domain-containing protein
MAGEGEDRIVVAVAPAPDKGKPVVSMLESIRDTADSANAAIAQLQRTIGQTGAAATIKQTLAQATAGTEALSKSRKKMAGNVGVEEKVLANVKAAEQWGKEWERQTAKVIRSREDAAKQIVTADTAAARENGRVRDRLYEDGVTQQKKALSAAKAASTELKKSATANLTVEQQINKAYADRARLAASVRDRQFGQALAQRNSQVPVAFDGERAFVPSSQAVFAKRDAAARILAAEEAAGEEIVRQNNVANDYKRSQSDVTRARRLFYKERALIAKQESDAEKAALGSTKAAALAAQRAQTAARSAARTAAIENRRLSSPVVSIGATIGTAFLGVAALREIVSLTDAYQGFSNKVKLVTEGERERVAVEKELFDISRRSRTDLEANVSLYQRLATSTGGLGVTQRDILQITETIGKAAIVGGSVGEEAEKGLLQLSQGFARGVLRGDELRSVLEQLPGVAEVLARHFKVARTDLAILAEQGKITATEMIKAFQGARFEIEEKFAKTVPTIGQAFTTMRTNIIEAFGGVQSRTGIFGAIAVSIRELGENLELLARILATAAIAKGLNLIKAAVAGIMTLTPGGIFRAVFAGTLVALADGEKVLDFFNSAKEKTKELKDELGILGTLVETTLAGLATGAFAVWLISLGSTGGVLASIVVQLNRVTTALKGLGAYAGVAAFLANPAVAAGAAAVGAAAYLGYTNREAVTQKVFEMRGGKGRFQEAIRRNASADGSAGIPGDATSGEFTVGADGSTFALDVYRDQTDPLSRQLAGQAGKLSKGGTGSGGGGQRRTFADFLREAQEQTRVLKEQGREHSIINGIMRVRRALWRDETKMTEEQEMLLRGVLEKQQAIRERNAFRDFKGQARDDRRLAGLVGDDRQALQDVLSVAQSANVTEGELRASGRAEKVEEISRRTSEETRYFEILRQIKPAQEEYAQNLATINQLYAEGQINLIQFTQASNDLAIRQLKSSGEFKDGLKAGFLELESQFANLSEAGSGLIVGTFNRATDALLEFTRTGKFEFTNFITEILTQIARLTLEQSLIAPLAKALSGALFGTGTSFFTPNAPTPGIDPTINNPGFDPTQLTLGGTGGASRSNNQGTQVYVENVNMAQGTKSEVNQSTGPNGEEFITILTRAVQEKDAEEFQYRMPPHLRQLGLSRQGVHR